MRGLFARLRLACLPTLALCSCLNLRYSRIVQLREPADGHYESLRPGESDLQACLDLLGAPLIVQEYAAGQALAWGWFEAADWSLSAQTPIGDQSASLSFQSVDGRMLGLLLLFDRDWRLIELRRGYLRELGRGIERRRPQLLKEEDGSKGVD